MSFKFQTFEDLEKSCPVGTKLNYHEKIVKTKKFWNNLKDQEIYLKQDSDAIFYDDGSCEVRETIKTYNEVDGYLFDGEYWYPAYQTWDGWMSIDDELDEGED